MCVFFLGVQKVVCGCVGGVTSRWTAGCCVLQQARNGWQNQAGQTPFQCQAVTGHRRLHVSSTPRVGSQANTLPQQSDTLPQQLNDCQPDSSQVTASLAVMGCWCVAQPLPGTHTQSVGCACMWRCPSTHRTVHMCTCNEDVGSQQPQAGVRTCVGSA